VVNGVTPNQGGSNQAVTISGCGFTGAGAVTFLGPAGPIAASSFSVTSDGTINAVTPFFPAGSVASYDIQVSTPRGTTPINPSDRYLGMG
jgi:hypothetical protein